MKHTSEDTRKMLMLTEQLFNIIDEFASLSHKSMAQDFAALNSVATRIRNSLVVENDEFDGGHMLIENASRSLEDVDDDSAIMDVPLNLKEACQLNFDKHINALLDEEDNASIDAIRREKLLDRGNVSEFNKRYLERSNNVIRFNKR